MATSLIDTPRPRRPMQRSAAATMRSDVSSSSGCTIAQLLGSCAAMSSVNGPERLAGRTILVTGAASGIGRASAARFLSEGAAVLGADVADRAEPPGAGRWESRVLDVRDEDAVAAVVQDAVALGGGRLDGVFHAAGVAGGGPVHVVDRAAWQEVLDVNRTGTFLVAKPAVTNMLDQERRDGER